MILHYISTYQSILQVDSYKGCVPPSQRNPVVTSFHCPYSHERRHVRAAFAYTPAGHYQQLNGLESSRAKEGITSMLLF